MFLPPTSRALHSLRQIPSIRIVFRPLLCSAYFCFLSPVAKSQEPTPTDPIVKAMQENVKANGNGEFTFEDIIEWNTGPDEIIDGESYQTGITKGEKQTILGRNAIATKALIKNGKVVRWVYQRTNMPISAAAGKAPVGAEEFLKKVKTELAEPTVAYEIDARYVQELWVTELVAEGVVQKFAAPEKYGQISNHSINLIEDTMTFSMFYDGKRFGKQAVYALSTRGDIISITTTPEEQPQRMAILTCIWNEGGTLELKCKLK